MSILNSLPQRFNLAQAILERAPASSSFVCADQQICRDTLIEEVHACACYLIDKGICSGDRVAIISHDCFGFVTHFLSLILVGALPVLINPLTENSLVLSMLLEAGAPFVVVDANWKQKLSSSAVQCLDIDHKPAHKYFDAIVTSKPDSPCFWAYTSGSTGKPKAVIHAHYSALVATEYFARDFLNIGQNDVLMSGPQMAFTFGLGTSIYMPLLLGATSIISPSFGTFDSIRLMQLHQPTVLFGVPSHYAALLSAHEIMPFAFDRLRCCICAGERLSATLCERFEKTFGLPLTEGIGTTESMHIFLCNQPGQAVSGSVGRAVPGYSLSVVDRSGKPVGPEAEGRLVVEAEGFMLGYYDRQQEQTELMPDGRLWLKDIFCYDEDGYYSFKCRSDDMVKIHGMWLSITALEEHFNQQADVGRAVAVLGPSAIDPSIQEPYVFIEGSTHAAKSLMRTVAKQLPKHQRPRKVIALDQLPLNPTGKVDRAKLVSMIQPGGFTMSCTKISRKDVPVIPNRTGHLQILINARTAQSKQMVMGLSRLDPGEKVIKHVHDYSDECFYVLKGQGKVVTEDCETHFAEGDAVLVKKSTVHEIFNTIDEPMEVVFCVAPLAPSPELGHRELVQTEDTVV